MKTNVLKLVTADRASHQPRSVKPIDKVIGEALRFERKAKGMTQEDTVAHLGISYQQLQKLEAGINRLSVARLVEVSQVLEFDPGSFVRDLVDEVDYPDRISAREVVQDMLLVNGSTELLQLYGGMLPEDRLALLKLARRLVKNERDGND